MTFEANNDPAMTPYDTSCFFPTHSLLWNGQANRINPHPLL